MPDPQHGRRVSSSAHPAAHRGAASRASDLASAGAAVAGVGSRVLIVDDNEPVTRALSLLMNRAGFDSVPCHRGAEAIAYARAEPPPCAAVVDIHLPDINGLDLARTLREHFGPTTPIIVVSGDTSMETIKALSHVGATHFFPKPVNSAALVARLKELTENDEARNQNDESMTKPE